MDGKIRLLDQIDYRSQPSLIRHCKSGINPKPELGESDNISQVELFECLVVGNIEKDGLDASRLRYAISSRKIGTTSGFGRVPSALLP